MKTTSFHPQTHILVAALVFAIIVAFILVALAVSPCPQRESLVQEDQVFKEEQTSKTFLVLSKECIGNREWEPFIYVIVDKKTQKEYLVVEDNTGVSITPRLP